ncbi:MAG TPA: hypothetical protein VNA15_02215 [Candidatus Angelobacter sp.]|nr:hypothetical protein [Candidatus Angelobacter sp.]
MSKQSQSEHVRVVDPANSNDEQGVILESLFSVYQLELLRVQNQV